MNGLLVARSEPASRPRGNGGRASTVDDLLRVVLQVRCAEPDLLALLVLAELLDQLASAHRLGRWHGRLTPAALPLGGPAPRLLVRDCPRDPRLRLVGCAVGGAGHDELGPGDDAALPAPWLAPEVRRREPPTMAADLYAAGAIAAALRRAAAGEGSRGPAGSGRVESGLRALCDSLQRPAPAERGTADAAAARCRELALLAMEQWNDRRAAPRRSAPTKPLDVSTATPRRAASAGRAIACSVTRSSAGAPRAAPAGARQAVADRIGPAEDRVGRLSSNGAWLAVAPAALAALLSLLLSAMMMLAGS